jgi:AraC-like DNA-binding protein
MKTVATWEQLLDQLRLEFGSAIFRRCRPDWHCKPRVLPDEQLHLIHTGALEYRIDGAIHAAHARQVVFCPPGVEWSVTRTSKTLIQLTVIHFHARFPGGRRFLEAFGFPLILKSTRAVWKELVGIGRELCGLYERRPAGHVLKEAALLYGFVHAFFPLRGAIAPVDRDGERVLKLIQFMRAHMRERITLESLSKQVFVSPNHLASIFRDYTGRSPIDYLIHLRLEEARRWLLSPDMPVTEIAARVGYDDAAYFSRLFRTHVGMSPLDFRHNRALLT